MSNSTENKVSLVAYNNKSERFLLKSRDYSRQYFHLYLYRLKEMTKLLEDKVKDKWGSDIPIKKLCDIREENEERCVIIGTLYKHQQLKPSILREISDEIQVDPQPLENYTSDNDKLILEDELQRIRLLGKIDIQYIVTGIVCAVLGFVESDGKFTIKDIIFYESGPQKSLSELKFSPLIVILSDLDQTKSDLTDSLELFEEWIFGRKKDFNDNPILDSTNIVRIIVAGNVMRASPPVKQKILQVRPPELPDNLATAKTLDKLFSKWSELIPTDIMPGEFDPANFLLPQQPFHSCIFPESQKNKNFKSVPNPYGCEINERFILGTSGQNINDIMRVSKITDPIEALCSTLTWSHICPTSPDTLPCYPYVEKDPFIIDECPHIYFAGNQKKFKTDLYKDKNKLCRLISVPSFARTQSVAVVDINTLECYQYNFKINETDEIDS